ncbi:MAG TPA: sulfatase, partial [Mycobacteriales bacterium]|nr:sulfatase [Mycobacteriales bacterium]
MSRARRAAGGVATALAVLLVAGALLAPDDLGGLAPRTFLRLPVELLIGAAVLVLLPPRPRRVAGIAGGTLLGLLALLKLVDIGFSAVLGRPFDLVLDWRLLGSATGVVEDSVGRLGAVGTVVGALLLVAVALVLMVLAVLRL